MRSTFPLLIVLTGIAVAGAGAIALQANRTFDRADAVLRDTADLRAHQRTIAFACGYVAGQQNTLERIGSGDGKPDSEACAREREMARVGGFAPAEKAAFPKAEAAPMSPQP